MSIVLILGSGPNVVTCRTWERGNLDKIVAINNAWSVRPDWDYLIHPEDFSPDRRPVNVAPQQQVITADDYVPLQNRFGGFVYAGGTMAFTAAYWTLAALRPKVIAMLGCDMVYPDDTPTHFYGNGDPDPLRADVTLRSLEAKSARLMILGALQGCAMVNLSDSESRLVFPKVHRDQLPDVRPLQFDRKTVEQAQAAETRLGYIVQSGRYWLEQDRFDVAEIDALDALWLRSARPA